MDDRTGAVDAYASTSAAGKIVAGRGLPPPLPREKALPATSLLGRPSSASRPMLVPVLVMPRSLPVARVHHVPHRVLGQAVVGRPVIEAVLRRGRYRPDTKREQYRDERGSSPQASTREPPFTMTSGN
jgi:hypothetical protein